jgi:hypothetical protein
LLKIVVPETNAQEETWCFSTNNLIYLGLELTAGFG